MNVSSPEKIEHKYGIAVMFVEDRGSVSTSSVAQHLSIGYHAAARIVELMEARGVASRPDHFGKRHLMSALSPTSAEGE